MPEVIISDYFYGDEAEMFQYFRIAKQLITDERFKGVSTDAKLLYRMLLDRMSLSAKNQWFDKDGRVYIYYTVEEICQDMTCGRDKAMKLLRELSAIGNNVNQLAHRANGRGEAERDEIDEAARLVRQTFRLVNNNFTATVPYELEQLRAENKEFLDDLSTRDQRMIFANVTLVHMADTLEQLDADTETLQSIGNESLCQFSILRYQQEDGLNTALPYGLRRVKTTRTLTTESAAVLMPFRVQEIQDAGGIFCGVNAVSKNLLICNRKRLLNPHGFILGVSGSGKSFSMKETITFIALSTGDDIIIIDAERE